MLKLASYDKSLILRQKARIIEHIFDEENKIEVERLFSDNMTDIQPEESK